MTIEIFTNRFKIEIDRNVIIKSAKSIANDYHKKIQSLGIILLSDSKLLEINRKHLNHNDLTDVISFNYSEDESVIDGELYISANRVRDNAKKFGQTTENETSRVIIHGILHLMGEEDSNAQLRKNMVEKEDYYLGQMKCFT